MADAQKSPKGMTGSPYTCSLHTSLLCGPGCSQKFLFSPFFYVSAIPCSLQRWIGEEVTSKPMPELRDVCAQAAMLAHDIIPDAVELLRYAQADGQYAAATLLFNMASFNQQARATVAASQAVEPLVRLLCHDSWCALLILSNSQFAL